MIDEKIFGEMGSISNAEKIGNEAARVIEKTINSNNAVGTIIGYYDEKLTILSVSSFLLHNLGYSYEEFEQFSRMSLRNIFYGENTTFLKEERFPNIHGMGEGEMLAKDGTPITVRMYKEDSVDIDGRKIWIMSVRVDWEHENVTLINGAIKSGLWYFDCDKEGKISEVHWSHAFRRILGYNDVYDFPNKMESWTDLLHPADKDNVLSQLFAAIKDVTNERKYNVEYRLKMHDGTYQWFRSNAEIVRRKDGTARRMTGVFININSGKKLLMQQKKAEAFHNAFTKTNLCEYYVNLKENTFESMKNENTIMTPFEKSGFWDELIAAFIDNYVCDEYKEEMRKFYIRDYIIRRMREIQGELNIECCIIVNEKRYWVRNVILHGDKENPDNVIVFLRDITDAKREAEIQKQLSVENEAMGHLIQSVTRLVDHFAVCDLEKDSYEYYMVNIQGGYEPQGKYSNFIEKVAKQYKILSSTENIKDLLLTDNIRKNISTENDIYRFEYCNMEETIYRSASFVPLEWKDGRLMKVLWVSIDATQEKKQEMESRAALKDALSGSRARQQSKNRVSYEYVP